LALDFDWLLVQRCFAIAGRSLKGAQEQLAVRHLVCMPAIFPPSENKLPQMSGE